MDNVRTLQLSFGICKRNLFKGSIPFHAFARESHSFDIQILSAKWYTMCTFFTRIHSEEEIVIPISRRPIQLRTSQWSLQNSSTIRWRKKGNRDLVGVLAWAVLFLWVFHSFYFHSFTTFPDTSKVVRRTPLRVVREISPRSVCKCMCTLKRGLNFFFNLYICDLQNR